MRKQKIFINFVIYSKAEQFIAFAIVNHFRNDPEFDLVSNTFFQIKINEHIIQQTASSGPLKYLRGGWRILIY